MCAFNPKKVFILEDVKDNPITEKVVSRLPHSQVEYIKTQRPSIIKELVKEFTTMKEEVDKKREKPKNRH
jgi:uncharacterized protein YlbG (UPF0298 family)